MKAESKERFYRRQKGIAYRMVGEEAVLVKSRDGKIITLNPTASLVWDKLDGKKGAEELAKEVCRKFGVGGETAQHDTKKFLRDLEKKGLTVKQ